MIPRMFWLFCVYIDYVFDYFLSMEKYTVVKGMGLSTLCGYPTANLDNFKHDPGVYTATCQYGNCLIFVEEEYFAEAHIIGFSGDLYGKELEIDNMERYTPETNRGIVYRFNQSFK